MAVSVILLVQDMKAAARSKELIKQRTICHDFYENQKRWKNHNNKCNVIPPLKTFPFASLDVDKVVQEGTNHQDMKPSLDYTSSFPPMSPAAMSLAATFSTEASGHKTTPGKKVKNSTSAPMILAGYQHQNPAKCSGKSSVKKTELTHGEDENQGILGNAFQSPQDTFQSPGKGGLAATIPMSKKTAQQLRKKASKVPSKKSTGN